MTTPSSSSQQEKRQVQGPWTDLALHTLGWKAFQDLCAHVCAEILRRPVEVFREAQDGGQDAVFGVKNSDGSIGDATVQCKFSSKVAGIQPGDVGREAATIQELVANGHAKTYVLITSMSLSAPVAVAIKAKLREYGVERPHVFGREFLVLAIKKSARLRALVPRVYGLGDLSTILDERAAAQTRKLLGHLVPTLQVYVPTAAHVAAVRRLSEHKLILLLGDPATGKSTIAALLATTAAEDANYHCFKADGPEELMQVWNPNEPGGFYWIDDAFGPNQLREDYVDRWIQIMPKLQAAIAEGNRFVLTSRRHIYEAAKGKLGTRNHPLLRDGKAIVDVGALTIEERRQILYNHLKAGTQTRPWKRAVKQFLDECARQPSFLPEIARRFGSRDYTKHLVARREDVLRFFREPKEHLMQTLRELSSVQQAALALVFLHGNFMPVGSPNESMAGLVERHFGTDRAAVANALIHLKGSFLIERLDEQTKQWWTFKHPTIADAVGAMLGEMEGMTELYLRGTKVVTLLSTVVCEGISGIRDALRVPEHLNPVLIEKIPQTPDGPDANRLLFSFLDDRASSPVFEAVIQAEPSLLARKAYSVVRLGYDSKIRTHARAFERNLLPDALRDETAATLEAGLVEDGDTSFLEDDEVLALIRPSRLLHLKSRIRSEYLANIDSMVQSIVSEADLDEEPESQFDDIDKTLSDLETLFENDDDAKWDLKSAAEAVSDGVKELLKQKDERDREREADAGYDWEYSAPARIERRELPVGQARGTPRSLFDDVDE